MDAIEVNRRQSATQQVIAFFEARPGIWIDARDVIAAVPEAPLSWRTRISDCRLERGATIENKQLYPGQAIEWGADGEPTVFYRGPRKSLYRFLPQAPVGPSADQYRDQTLFNLPEGR